VTTPALTLDGRTLGRWAFNGLAAAVLIFVLVPLFFVTWLSFFQQEIPSFPPEGYSLKWFRAIWSNAKFVDGFVLSLEVAVIAMLTGLVLAVPAALCIARFRFPGREGLNSLLLLPLVVPGIVLGTSIYVFHVELQSMSDDVMILGSIAGLIGGHILLVIPWCVRLVTASLAGFDRSIEEAAMSLGATPTRTFFRVTLPVIRPGIVAAALFGFVVSFGNLEMTLFLVGAGRTTLPIAILQYLEWKIDPTIAAVSVLQISLIAAAMIVTDRFVKLARVV
jgi:putative spermidine/putrescine transport system permease protein